MCVFMHVCIQTRCPCLLAREPMLACSLYALLGLGDSIVRTTQPLWLLSSQAHHGFALQSDQIGMLIASPAPVEILFQAGSQAPSPSL